MVKSLAVVGDIGKGGPHGVELHSVRPRGVMKGDAGGNHGDRPRASGRRGGGRRCGGRRCGGRCGGGRCVGGHHVDRQTRRVDIAAVVGRGWNFGTDGLCDEF